MKRLVLGFLTIGMLIGFSGCAHKISVTPALDKLRKVNIDNKVNINVGYYLSDNAKQMEVTTPGGGGDKVKYNPYADTEGALNTILSKKFNRVYSLKSLEDKKYIDEKKIKYIFTPKIKTDSSSKNIMFWPPNDFTVELTCTAINLNSTIVWEKTVYAEGHTRTKEMLHDFSLSAKRATENAFKKMLDELNKTKKFNINEGI